jgi:hypothetical protein
MSGYECIDHLICVTVFNVMCILYMSTCGRLTKTNGNPAVRSGRVHKTKAIENLGMAV